MYFCFKRFEGAPSEETQEVENTQPFHLKAAESVHRFLLGSLAGGKKNLCLSPRITDFMFAQSKRNFWAKISEETDPSFDLEPITKLLKPEFDC